MLAPQSQAIQTINVVDAGVQVAAVVVLGVEGIKVRKQGHAGISGMYFSPSHDRTTARPALPQRSRGIEVVEQGARFLLGLIDQELL
jgi:hypothetical protein